MEERYLLAILGYATGTLAAISITLGRLLRRARRDLRLKTLELEKQQRDSTSLQRIEAALDGLGIEVERLGEVDRFAAQLLQAQRRQENVQPRHGAPRNILQTNTPH